MVNIVYATAESEDLGNPFVTVEPDITGNLFGTGSNEAPVIGTGTWETGRTPWGVKPFSGRARNSQETCRPTGSAG